MLSRMVKVGKRASALASLLEAGGLNTDVVKPGPPRLDDLRTEMQAEVLDLYRALGGASDRPTLRPGAWDLSMSGILIEIDEELHFNRYRRITLHRPWATSLPWAVLYDHFCDEREDECLQAGAWGRRWSTPSSARMFGAGAPPKRINGGGGAPRWKQRALYDAMKDAAAQQGDLRVARLSVYDEVSGLPLGGALEGRYSVDLDDLCELLLIRVS